MSRGADINRPAIRLTVETTLITACSYNPLITEEKARNMSLVQFLIEQGADVNAATGSGQTALKTTVSHGDIEIAVLLLHHGAKLNAIDRLRGTALDVAAYSGRIDMVQLLLNVGALSADEGQTGYDGAIRRAKEWGYFAVADLIQHNVENDAMLFGGNLAFTF